MNKKSISLDFGEFTLDAELFDSTVSKKFAQHLPYTVSLEKWGEEVYGPIGINLGEESPIPEIQPGGIAYTNNGNFVCVFFGQRPAWDVEYIGQIVGDGWKKLCNNHSLTSVTIKLNQ